MPKSYPHSEQALQNACIEFLQYRQFYVIRMNSGMIRSEYKGKERLIKMGVSGTPDLLCIKPATAIPPSPLMLYWMEIKLPGKKSTPIQKAKQDELRSLGCKVFEIHSLEELADAIK
jgi:hypothetical protein